MMTIPEVMEPVLLFTGFTKNEDNRFVRNNDEIEFMAGVEPPHHWISLIVGDSIVFEGRVNSARQGLRLLWAYDMIPLGLATVEESPSEISA